MERDVLCQRLGNFWIIISETAEGVVYKVLPVGFELKQPFSANNIELYEIIE
jgi:hypothetical protein